MTMKRNFCTRLVLLGTIVCTPYTLAENLTYQWDFGDGNTSTEENPNHQYATPDFYTVTLKAFADKSLSYSKQYEVDAVTPAIKSLTLNLPEQIEQGKSTQISVNLNSTYDLNLDYKWTFPNNKVVMGKSSEVVFQDSGDTQIALTAYFKDRPISEQNITINVLAAQEPDKTTPPKQDEGSSGGSFFWINLLLIGLLRIRVSVK
ncbi:PKD domain-containing protein [Pseudoalteromonas luteoviolacea]|uniref:PKD domain-containing protein n=1 Tax=Pseudoalteromonas luteoviolacea TaxID=43657 RepID=UPI001FFD34C7|nr:PKD domain-containing protein [Pseudoalteromonas luteoviolacea]